MFVFTILFKYFRSFKSPAQQEKTDSFQEMPLNSFLQNILVLDINCLINYLLPLHDIKKNIFGFPLSVEFCANALYQFIMMYGNLPVKYDVCLF